MKRMNFINSKGQLPIKLNFIHRGVMAALWWSNWWFFSWK